VKVAQILDNKGRETLTVRPDAPLLAAVLQMRRHNVGALVVSDDGAKVQGIISERDVVRGLAESGQRLLAMQVGDVMSKRPTTCTSDNSVNDVMNTMTQLRVRHLPVLDGGRLCGVVSIGDVVKSCLREAELEVNVLRDAYLLRRR
jgi:CBS domain-containing protein